MGVDRGVRGGIDEKGWTVCRSDLRPTVRNWSEVVFTRTAFTVVQSTSCFCETEVSPSRSKTCLPQSVLKPIVVVSGVPFFSGSDVSLRFVRQESGRKERDRTKRVLD